MMWKTLCFEIVSLFPIANIVTTSKALVTSSVALVSNSVLVTTSKALVTSSVALVPNSSFIVCVFRAILGNFEPSVS